MVILSQRLKDLMIEGLNCFECLSKEEGQATIDEVFNMAMQLRKMVNKEYFVIVTKHISKEELLQVLTSFQKDKMPRLDGWSIEFFIGFYEMIEEDQIRVIEKSRLNGKFLATLNINLICMIPSLIILNPLRNLDPSLCAIVDIKLQQRSLHKG